MVEFPDDLTLREVVDADSAAVIDLVARCYAEYEGCVLLVDEEEPELRCPASTAKFTRFWVVCAGGGGAGAGVDVGSESGSESESESVVGMVGVKTREDHVELKKLYLDPSVRGRSLSRYLVGVVEDFARAEGRGVVELWSDSRFLTAHAVYAHLGYRATGGERELGDVSKTLEYHFTKSLRLRE